mmetsp:Transcript_59055/g.101715  ORF Transcript_59055/g.101715 Transcript_59055/m.101715 type:complete len:229 (-) Transcript_59055:245-931(-)
MPSLLSAAVSVTVVKDDAEIKQVSKFFVRSFFDRTSTGDDTAITVVEGDAFADWVKRFGSRQNWDSNIIGRDTNQGVLLVAKEFGRVVGCASVATAPYSSLGSDGRSSRDGTAIPNRVKSAPVPVIANLAVSPSARRRGIAARLVGACERKALEWDFQEISLAVDASNIKAQRLYQKLGYDLLWDQIKATKLVLGTGGARSTKTVNMAFTKDLKKKRGVFALLGGNWP